MTYEYRCGECGMMFDVTASVAEKEAGLHPKCPSCGSKRAAQVFGAIGVLSGTRGGSSRGFGGMPNCGPDMGAGCC
jgi:putative FmdB family regulatory protein